MYSGDYLIGEKTPVLKRTQQHTASGYAKMHKKQCKAKEGGCPAIIQIYLTITERQLFHTSPPAHQLPTPRKTTFLDELFKFS